MARRNDPVDRKSHPLVGKTHFEISKTRFEIAKVHFEISKDHFETAKVCFEISKSHFEIAKVCFEIPGVISKYFGSFRNIIPPLPIRGTEAEFRVMESGLLEGDLSRLDQAFLFV